MAGSGTGTPALKPLSRRRRAAHKAYRTGAGGAAAIPAFGAALAKAFGYSFGAVCLTLFFAEGILASGDITAAMLTAPVIALGAVAFVSVGTICLGMEGINNWREFYGKLTGQSRKELRKGKSAENRFAWRANPVTRLAAFTGLPFAYALPVLGALAKGATMGFGTFVSLAIIFGVSSGPWGWVLLSIALTAGAAVAFVSLSKEGKDTFKKICSYLGWVSGREKNPDETTIDWFNKGVGAIFSNLARWTAQGLLMATGLYFVGGYLAKKKAVREAMGWVLPVAAASGKAFGNAFGVVKIIGLLSGLGMLSPYNIPIILVVACCEFLICMSFEGNELRTHCDRGIASVLKLEDKPDAKTVKRNSYFMHGLRKTAGIFPKPVRYVIGWTIPCVSALAKCSTMTFGTYTTLSLLVKIGVLSFLPLSFSSPAGIAVIAAIGFIGLCVAAVSLTKEGRRFARWIINEETKAPRDSTASARSTKRSLEADVSYYDSLDRSSEMFLALHNQVEAQHSSALNCSPVQDGIPLSQIVGEGYVPLYAAAQDVSTVTFADPDSAFVQQRAEAVPAY